jgi:hypothetical protein
LGQRTHREQYDKEPHCSPFLRKRKTGLEMRALPGEARLLSRIKEFSGFPQAKCP